MNASSFPETVVMIGNYPPLQCGIATFTRNLRQALVTERPERAVPVLAASDPDSVFEYPEEVRFEIAPDDREAYVRAGRFTDILGARAVCVQHEFGIYGGAAGGHLLAALDACRLPVVTTLHTVLGDPTPEQRRVFERLIERSSRLVVMTEKGRRLMEEVWQADPRKLEVIPHGIPDVPFADPNFFREDLDLAGRRVILTFGLISPGKGIEDGIRAMPGIARRHPEALYVILGATHPNLRRAEGERYRRSMEALAAELGVTDHVRLVNRYVDDDELNRWIGAADIYLTPYLQEAQITSGTLAYSFGAGKAVVSTPYWHAAELLAGGRGRLVGFRRPDEIASAINGLFANDDEFHHMRLEAYIAGRGMIWPAVARRYHEVFETVAAEGVARIPRRGAGPRLEPVRNPVSYGHLHALTDSTGVFQHARHHLPWFEHGYCTDDNARALLLTVRLEALGELDAGTRRVQTNAAAFLDHAFDRDARRFRNFMSFDRRWLEECGSEDSQARALWALGATVADSRHPALSGWAADLFEEGSGVAAGFGSPRAWAFAVLGLNEYLRRFAGDRRATRLRRDLAGRLADLHRAVAGPGWHWFEDIVAYDNPRICQALIGCGADEGDPDLLEPGLETLTWLLAAQTGTDGCFRPVGSDGFWHRGQAPARFDQQPLEAAAAVAAALEAWRATGAPRWHKEARRAFDWFLGRNDLRLPLVDERTGGCHDGLQPHGVNRNQGAESTLSLLLADADLRLADRETDARPAAQPTSEQAHAS